MNHKELQDLIKLVSKSNLTEFKLSKGDFKLAIRTKKYAKNQQISHQPPMVQVPASTSVPATHVSVAPSVAPAPEIHSASDPIPKTENTQTSSGGTDHLIEIKSPIVGTFYRSPSPDKPSFIKVGDRVEAGDVVCIVEAMKLFNEIESEVSGEVVKVLAEDASPVEYDQPLFLIDPTK